MKREPEKLLFIYTWILSLFSRLFAFVFNMRHDFLNVFFIREGQEIAGKNLRSFGRLILIMVLTFTAIGFSNGSLDYLQKKMSNPFIMWLTIDMPRGNSRRVNELMEVFAEKKTSEEFGFDTISFHYVFNQMFFDQSKEHHKRMKGRTVEYNSPILEQIFADDNLIQGKPFESEYDIGLIVTTNFLSSLGYDPLADFAFLDYSTNQPDVPNAIPIPVTAIVEQLPDNAAYMCTNYFYNQHYLDIDGWYPFSPTNTHDLIITFPAAVKGSAYQKLKSEIEELILHWYAVKASPSFTEEIMKQTYLERGILRASFLPEFESVAEVISLYRRIDDSLHLSELGVIQYFDYKLTDPFEYTRQDYIAIKFTHLDQINAFADYMMNEHQIQVEMSQIESKKNFNFISKLTRFITLILLLFSIISISVFLSNLLRNHLEKIKMNIGTFLAFGFKKQTLKKIYMSIIGVMICVSITVSLMLSGLFGYLGGVRLVLKLLNIELESNESYFSFLDWWTLVAVLSIGAVTLYAIYFKNSDIFNQQPGVLINNREFNNKN